MSKNLSKDTLKFSLKGRLDTNTASTLAEKINGIESDLKKLVLDFEQLEYVSSAGLRVLLTAQKKMNKQGGMIVKNVNQMVMEVFEITGFVDILTIE